MYVCSESVIYKACEVRKYGVYSVIFGQAERSKWHFMDRHQVFFTTDKKYEVLNPQP